jgi:hypothetical protein
VTKENKILVKNNAQKAVVLTLEPWAEQYILHPGLQLELRQVISKEIEPIEIEYTEAGITVFSGGIVTVFCNGEEVVAERQWIDRIE